jgi:hypothetical protein
MPICGMILALYPLESMHVLISSYPVMSCLATKAEARHFCVRIPEL